MSVQPFSDGFEGATSTADGDGLFPSDGSRFHNRQVVGSGNGIFLETSAPLVGSNSLRCFAHPGASPVQKAAIVREEFTLVAGDDVWIPVLFKIPAADTEDLYILDLEEDDGTTGLRVFFKSAGRELCVDRKNFGSTLRQSAIVDFPFDQPVTVLLHAKLGADSTGLTELYQNGVRLLSVAGPNLTTSGKVYTRFTVGITANMSDVDQTVYADSVGILDRSPLADLVAFLVVGDNDPPSPDAPPAPTNLAATVLANQVQLNWDDNPPPVLGYNVYRATLPGSTFTKLNGSLVAASAYVDTAVVGGVSYSYRVTAVNASGEGGNSGGVIANLPSAAPPIPTGVVVSDDGVIILVSWGASTGATSYVVRRSLTAGGPYVIVSTQAGLSFGDFSVVQGTRYYYVVSSVNAQGESGLSAEVNHQIPIPTIDFGHDLTSIEVFLARRNAGSPSDPLDLGGDEARVQITFDRVVRAGQACDGSWWVKKHPNDPALKWKARMGPRDGGGVCLYQPTRARLRKKYTGISLFNVPIGAVPAYKDNGTKLGAVWDTLGSPVPYDEIGIYFQWDGGNSNLTVVDGDTTFGLQESDDPNPSSSSWQDCSFPATLSQPILVVHPATSPNPLVKGKQQYQVYTGSKRYIRVKLTQINATIGLRPVGTSAFRLVRQATYDVNSPGPNADFFWDRSGRHGVMKNLRIERPEDPSTSKWGFDSRIATAQNNVHDATSPACYDGTLCIGDPLDPNGGWIGDGSGADGGPLQAGDTFLISVSMNPTSDRDNTTIGFVQPYGNPAYGNMEAAPGCDTFFQVPLIFVDKPLSPTLFSFPVFYPEPTVRGRDMSAYARKLGPAFDSDSSPYRFDSANIDLSKLPAPIPIPTGIMPYTHLQMGWLTTLRYIWFCASAKGETSPYVSGGVNAGGYITIEGKRTSAMLAALLSDSYTLTEKRQILIRILQDGLDAWTCKIGGQTDIINNNGHVWLRKFYPMFFSLFMNRPEIAAALTAPLGAGGWATYKHPPELTWEKHAFSDDAFWRPVDDAPIPPDIDRFVTNRGPFAIKGRSEAADYYNTPPTPGPVVMTITESSKPQDHFHPDFVGGMARSQMLFSEWPKKADGFQPYSNVLASLGYTRQIAPSIVEHAILLHAFPQIVAMWNRDEFWIGAKRWLEGNDAKWLEAYALYVAEEDQEGVVDTLVTSNGAGTVLSRTTSAAGQWPFGNSDTKVGTWILWDYVPASGGTPSSWSSMTKIQALTNNIQAGAGGPVSGQVNVSPPVTPNVTRTVRVMKTTPAYSLRGLPPATSVAGWLVRNGYNW